MQIFLTNKKDLEKAAQDLDDLRLKKQIVELVQLLGIKKNEYKYELKKQGHQSHSVYKHYNNYICFMLKYLEKLLDEYVYRFGKDTVSHCTYDGYKLFFRSVDNYNNFKSTVYAYIKGTNNIELENVEEKYRALLIEKWNTDIRKPIWTNREIPKFYRDLKVWRKYE